MVSLSPLPTSCDEAMEEGEREASTMKAASTRYLPWTGPNYGANSKFGMGILIVGESHYDFPGCRDDASLTQTVFADANSDSPFRKSVAEAVLGRTVDAATFREFWDSVAMYNYVRRLLAKGEHATEMDLRDPEACVAFTDEVLPSLQPDCIFVFSKKIWNWLPQFGRTDSKMEKEIGREAGWYNCRSGRYALAVGLTHPSRWKFDGESPSSQHQFIAKALAALRHRKKEAHA
jgi:hypothetical protein